MPQMTTEEWKPKINPWIMIIPVMLAVFIYVLDGTIGNVALPHMAGSFSATRDESMWILTSYLIAAGIVIPAVDFFSKLCGRKNFFIISILMFTIASMLCGMAKNIEFMIFARILQGFGGGGILPISQAIIIESFTKEQRGAAMSVFGMGVILAPIIGPVLGGWITDNWTWPWIFYINVPFGCIAALLSKKLIEDPPYAKRQHNVKIDGKGFFYLTIWLVTLQTVLDKGNNADWFNATWICWTFGVSVVACILFFHSQLTNKDSLVDLSVFKDRNFSAGTIIQVVIQAVLYASLAILPQFLQSMMGYTAFLSGATMMPRGFGSMLSMLITGTLSNKIDNRLFVMLGLALIGGSSLVFGSLNLQISNMNIAIPNFFMGMGMGLSMIPIMNLSVDTLKNEQMTNATGIQNLLKNIGSAIGTSLVATMLTRFAQVHQYMLVGKMSELNPVFIERIQTTAGALSAYTEHSVAQYMAQYSYYGQLVKQSTLWAFIDSFRIFGVLCLAVIPLLLLMKKIKKDA
ncbi:drug resistance transporter EmrB/QacA subfamily [Clostridium sp. CAG:715]|nr:drug resistance transporter EmrB/QacA subfamily [Clostridium sp. CAG:715]